MSFYKENRPKQKRFYSSKKWLRCRDTYLSEHPFCERCIKAGIAVPSEHVHHIIELDEIKVDDPMLALNPDNLEALCFECHNKEHHGRTDCDKDFFFDADGNLKRGATESQK